MSLMRTSGSPNCFPIEEILRGTRNGGRRIGPGKCFHIIGQLPCVLRRNRAVKTDHWCPVEAGQNGASDLFGGISGLECGRFSKVPGLDSHLVIVHQAHCGRAIALASCAVAGNAGHFREQCFAFRQRNFVAWRRGAQAYNRVPVFIGVRKTRGKCFDVFHDRPAIIVAEIDSPRRHRRSRQAH